MPVEVRRYWTVIEEIEREAGQALPRTSRRVAVAAVMTNPFAGRFEPDLAPLIEAGGELGRLLTEKAVALLDGAAIESYGKGAIVGTGGEIEHAAALIHPTYGVAVRAVTGGGAAVIPSTKKVGGPGSTIDIPLHYKEAATVGSHFDAIEVAVPAAPRADEIVVAIALTDSGRPLPRIGGLAKEEVKGEDGLR